MSQTKWVKFRLNSRVYERIKELAGRVPMPATAWMAYQLSAAAMRWKNPVSGRKLTKSRPEEPELYCMVCSKPVAERGCQNLQHRDWEGWIPWDSRPAQALRQPP